MPLIATDTETGGFKPEQNALLSVAMVELDADLMPTDRRLSLFILPEPKFSVEEGAAKVNGYTPELWAERKAVSLCEAMEAIAAWMPEKAEALAHNSSFDRSFVHHAEALTGISTKLSRQWSCSLELFRSCSRLFRWNYRDHKLGTLAAACGHWGPDYQRGAHQAIDDALACAAGYRWLQEKLKPPARGPVIPGLNQ